MSFSSNKTAPTNIDLDSAQTLTNKTLTAPTITAGTHSDPVFTGEMTGSAVDKLPKGGSETVHLIRANSDGSTDFTISSDTDVPDYAGSDILSATFSVPSSGTDAILSNDDANKVYKLAGAAGSQYDGQGIVLAVDKRARGTDILVSMDYRTYKTTGDSSNGDYQLHIYDKTNTTLLTDSLTLFPANDSDTDKESKQFKKYVLIPADCAEIVVFVQQRTAATDTTMFFDNILVSADPFQKVETQGTAGSVRYHGHAGFGATNTKIPYFTTIVEDAITTCGVVDNDATDGFSFTATSDCAVVITYGVSIGSVTNVGFSLNSSQLTTALTSITDADRVAEVSISSAGFWSLATANIIMKTGDIIRPHIDSGASSTNSRHRLNIIATPQKGTAIIVESADSVMSDWTSYAGTGSFTNTTYDGYWRRVGDTMEVQVGLTMTGTPGTATLSIDLPSGYLMDTAKINDQETNYGFGICGGLDSGTGNWVGTVMYATTSSVNCAYVKVTAGGDSQGGGTVTDQLPAPFVVGDGMQVRFSVPIAGWSAVNKPLLAIPTITVGQNAETFNAVIYAGYGSTNTHVPYYTTVNENTVSNLGTVTNDATSGCIFTASTRCKVTMSFWNSNAAIAVWAGISKNGDLTNNITATANDAYRLSAGKSQAVNESLPMTSVTICEAGDIVAGSTDSTTSGDTNTYACGISILVEPELGQQNHAAIISAPVVILEDRSTVNGGSSSATAMHTRVLNTLSGDIAAVGITLTNGTAGIDGTNNEFTLPVGTFELEWTTPALNPTYNQSQLYNQTDAEITKLGKGIYCVVGTVIEVVSEGHHIITLTKPTAFRIFQYIASARAADGLGAISHTQSNNSATYSIYSTCKITRKA
tara:strand:- start:3872 stop:6487 length:2616 start_codon:yes stop_codon:yes gene_type:complete